MFGYFLTKNLCMLFGVIYPAWKSFKALKLDDQTEKFEQLCFWTKYWTTTGLFWCFEFYADIVVSWLPFYYEIKILVVFWLVYGRGGEIIYNAHVAPKFSHHEPEIDVYLGELKSRFGRAVLNWMKFIVSWAQQRFINTFWENQTRSLLNRPPVDLFGNPIVDDAADLRNSSQANILQFLSKQPSIDNARTTSSKDLASSKESRPAISAAPQASNDAVSAKPSPAVDAGSVAAVPQTPKTAAAVAAAPSASTLPPDSAVAPATSAAAVSLEPQTRPAVKSAAQPESTALVASNDYFNRVDHLNVAPLVSGMQDAGESKPRTAQEFRAALQTKMSSSSGSISRPDSRLDSSTRPSAESSSDAQQAQRLKSAMREDNMNMTLRSTVKVIKTKKVAENAAAAATRPLASSTKQSAVTASARKTLQ
eukprot:TRINITY_DN8692_c0_g1_i1.p1 TRINITY_DN8692_c0_g1~~TRINITY_DN8692_c0_g1_i1.p1  ORF type:complete len:422 (-),score=34.60 TRINITY_DN8692_c0_g1_i1:88-1353(-)